MEPSEPQNNIILNNCLFVFDKAGQQSSIFLTNFSNLLRNCITTIPGGDNCIYLMFLKLILKYFGSNSIEIMLINDWNKMIRKIHFSSELLFKQNEFIKLVKNTFVT